MNSRWNAAIAIVAGLILIAVAPLVGCGHEAGDHVAAAHDKIADAVHGADAAPELDPAAKQEAIAKVLAAADALDGETDNVVAKCPGCKLAMDGKAEHAAQVGDYELHFCSASCAEHFTEDTETSLLALKVIGSI